MCLSVAVVKPKLMVSEICEYAILAYFRIFLPHISHFYVPHILKKNFHVFLTCLSSSGNDSSLLCSGCAVISDSDFGDIHTFEQCEKKPISLPSQKIDPQQIVHLTLDDLLTILDKYPKYFHHDPVLCTLVQHEINLLPGCTPKRLKAYHVPECLKPQVSKEIQLSLELGVIRPANSDMVSALVVLLKGPGGRDGIRLAVDYSYKNKFTRNDPFPVPDIDVIINQIAHTTMLSCFDMSQGYF